LAALKAYKLRLQVPLYQQGPIGLKPESETAQMALKYARIIGALVRQKQS